MRNRRFAPSLESMEVRITPSNFLPLTNDGNDGAPASSDGFNHKDDPGGLPIYVGPGKPIYNPTGPLLIYLNN